MNNTPQKITVYGPATNITQIVTVFKPPSDTRTQRYAEASKFHNEVSEVNGGEFQ